MRALTFLFQFQFQSSKCAQFQFVLKAKTPVLAFSTIYFGKKWQKFSIVREGLDYYVKIFSEPLSHTAESVFLSRDRDRPVTVPSPSRHHPVTVPFLGVLNRPTSLSVLNRP